MCLGCRKNSGRAIARAVLGVQVDMDQHAVAGGNQAIDHAPDQQRGVQTVFDPTVPILAIEHDQQGEERAPTGHGGAEQLHHAFQQGLEFRGRSLHRHAGEQVVEVGGVRGEGF